MDFDDKVKNALLTAGLTAALATGGAVDADAQGTQNAENTTKDKGKTGQVIGQVGIGFWRAIGQQARNGQAINIASALGAGVEQGAEVLDRRNQNAEQRRENSKWQKNQRDNQSEWNKWNFDEQMVQKMRDNMLNAASQYSTPVPVYADAINVMRMNAQADYEHVSDGHLTENGIKQARDDFFQLYAVDVKSVQFQQAVNLADRLLAKNTPQDMRVLSMKTPYVPGELMNGGDRERALEALGIFDIGKLLKQEQSQSRSIQPANQITSESKSEVNSTSIDGMDEKKVATWAKFLASEMRNQRDIARKMYPSEPNKHNNVGTQLKAMAVIYMDIYEQTGEKPTPKQLRAFYKQATGDTEFNIIPRETSLTQQCIEFIEAEKAIRIKEATKDIETGKKEGSKVKELNGKERLQQLGDLKISANLDLKSLGVEGMKTLRTAKLESNVGSGMDIESMVDKATNPTKNLDKFVNKRGGGVSLG